MQKDTQQSRSRYDRGIAVAPILFVVAILAVLVGALSSGSGGFGSNTQTERAKASASSLAQVCANYQMAMRKLTVSNECDPYRIDYTPPNLPVGTTWTNADRTGGNGTNRMGTGRCALFHPNGGGMIYRQVVPDALATTRTGAYSAQAASADIDLFAGSPVFHTYRCIRNAGMCGSDAYANRGALIMGITYVNLPTCQALNAIYGRGVVAESKTVPLVPWNNTFNGSNIQPFGAYTAGIVRDDGNDVAGVMARWDFVPFFFKQPLETKKWTSINAKVEEIKDKPAFRGAIKSKRCLIPNNGFYEWKTENGKKQPYWFQPTDTEVGFFGGIWDFWEGTHKGEPAGFISFAILTCEPNSLVRDVHNRMPVIVRPEDYETWMYGERDEALKIAEAPYPAQMMRMAKVDPAVGNVKNDYEGLLATAAP